MPDADNTTSSSSFSILPFFIVPLLGSLVFNASYNRVEREWPGVNESAPSFSAESLAQAQTGVVCEVVRQPKIYKEFGPSAAGQAYVAGSMTECEKFKGPIIVWTVDDLKTGQNVNVVWATGGKGEGKQYALPKP